MFSKGFFPRKKTALGSKGLTCFVKTILHDKLQLTARTMISRSGSQFDEFTVKPPLATQEIFLVWVPYPQTPFWVVHGDHLDTTQE